MEIFDWRPTDYDSSEAQRALTAQFGDSYEQCMADGLNSQLQKWSLKFEKQDKTTALAIRTFLKARGKVEAFLFTNSYNEQIKVKCDDYKLTPVANNNSNIKRFITVTATFREVP